MEIPSSTVKLKKLKHKEKYLSREEEEMVVKWANHYSSVQQILLVGDGDFSFSLCLANAFGSASNIVATSLDSYETLLKKYSRAKSNLERLKKLGATILHEIDATKMKFHVDLKMQKFDRIVFNFPHAGFKGKEDSMRLINLHKQLVSGFFKNASHMLRPYGEVHVSHKTGGPFHKWNLEELALKNSLILTECAKFSIDDYPGYNNKRGDSHRCDHPFPLGECSTFKFRIGGIHEIKRRKEAKSTTGANNISGNNLRARVSSSFHHPQRFGTHDVHYVHPNTERTVYRPYVNEAFVNDVLFDYLKRQEEVRNQSILARLNLWAGISNPLYHPPRLGIDNLHRVHPNIGNPLRIGYRACVNEASLNDALFDNLKFQEELRSRGLDEEAG